MLVMKVCFSSQVRTGRCVVHRLGGIDAVYPRRGSVLPLAVWRHEQQVKPKGFLRIESDLFCQFWSLSDINRWGWLFVQQFAVSVGQKGFRQQRSLSNVPRGAAESVVTREETSARKHQPFTTLRQERLRIRRRAEVRCHISLGWVPWGGQHMLCIRFGQDYYLPPTVISAACLCLRSTAWDHVICW